MRSEILRNVSIPSQKKRTPPILGSLYCNPLVASIDTPANTKAVVTEPLGRKELTERKKMVNCPK